MWSEARASQAPGIHPRGKQLIIHYLKVTELFTEYLFRLCCSFCYVTIANYLLFWVHALYISLFLIQVSSCKTNLLLHNLWGFFLSPVHQIFVLVSFAPL